MHVNVFVTYYEKLTIQPISKRPILTNYPIGRPAPDLAPIVAGKRFENGSINLTLLEKRDYIAVSAGFYLSFSLPGIDFDCHLNTLECR